MKDSSAILGSEDLMTSLSPTAFLDVQVRAAARGDQEAFARLVALLGGAALGAAGGILGLSTAPVTSWPGRATSRNASLPQ